ncbi:hypothetical protein [Oscillibacter sp.]|jgi:hypothetical protein|uniref:hypothetical protein n=1 Tax=Oscillibacter sp. TaxID=1945593 RepID=UPI0028A24353|nr:hypothetical protein [Oscillibacter sp.]
MKLLRILKSNRGDGYPLVVAVTLALLLVFCVAAEYFRLNIIVQGVRDAAAQSVISVISDNYDDVYHSTREGYAAGWYPTDDAWDESTDIGAVYTQLTTTLGLAYENGAYMKYSGEDVEYTLSGLEVEVDNNALSSGEAEGFLADVTIVLDVPTRFCGVPLPSLHLTLETQAKYIPKF